MLIDLALWLISAPQSMVILAAGVVSALTLLGAVAFVQE